MSDVHIKGRSPEKAILYLAAAEDLGLDASVVRTTSDGYLLPEEIIKASEKPAQQPAKKAAAKKATAKKTTAKKAAAKKTASKE